MVAPPNAVCPHCKQRAPIVLRGIDARCTVCDGRRIPFVTTSLNLAGKPSRFGGFAAKLTGCATLVIGAAAASGLGLLAQTLLGGYAGLAVALPISILTLAIGISLLVGGRMLRRSGERKQAAVQMQTIDALIEHKQGVLTAGDAAQALGLPEPEADALLTDMAKDPNRQVSLDLDDDGVVHYLFGERGAARRWRALDQQAVRVRVDTDADADDATQSEAEWEAAEAQRTAAESVRRWRP